MVDFLIYEPFFVMAFYSLGHGGHQWLRSKNHYHTTEVYQAFDSNRIKTGDYNWFLRLTFTVYISQACCSFLNLMLRCGCGRLWQITICVVMDINIDSSKAMLSGALPADGQDNNKGLIIAHTNTLGLFLRNFARSVFSSLNAYPINTITSW